MSNCQPMCGPDSDSGVFPSQASEIFDGIAASDKEFVTLPGDHYFIEPGDGPRPSRRPGRRLGRRQGVSLRAQTTRDTSYSTPSVAMRPRATNSACCIQR